MIHWIEWAVKEWKHICISAAQHHHAHQAFKHRNNTPLRNRHFQALSRNNRQARL